MVKLLTESQPANDDTSKDVKNVFSPTLVPVSMKD